jgi:hypothetical protein
MAIPRSTEFGDLLRRVRGEYGEAPNLRLTPSQAQRLFGLDPPACVAVLDALVNESFLSRTQDGLFVRAPCTD